MGALNWIIPALASLLIVGGVAMTIYSASLQRARQAQAMDRVDESVRLQREANALLREISSKLDRDRTAYVGK